LKRLAGDEADGDYAAAEHFWLPSDIQHSAHIAAVRDGLFNLVTSLPPTLRYELGRIVAEGGFVIVPGRFSGFAAPASWPAHDIRPPLHRQFGATRLMARTPRLISYRCSNAG